MRGSDEVFDKLYQVRVIYDKMFICVVRTDERDDFNQMHRNAKHHVTCNMDYDIAEPRISTWRLTTIMRRLQSLMLEHSMAR